jgi:hypothetical protein
MRKTIATILGALLIAGATVQVAAAAERYTHKTHRAPLSASQQFRNANNSMAWPNAYDSLARPSVIQQDLSDYSEGHVISAPAGQ